MFDLVKLAWDVGLSAIYSKYLENPKETHMIKLTINSYGKLLREDQLYSFFPFIYT